MKNKIKNNQVDLNNYVASLENLEKLIFCREMMMSKAMTPFIGRPNHTKALNELNKAIESLSNK